MPMLRRRGLFCLVRTRVSARPVIIFRYGVQSEREEATLPPTRIRGVDAR
jgi:hypothetical protein